MDSLEQFLGQSLRYFSPAERTFALLLTCSSSEEKDDDLITIIERYLNENYSDPSLGLNKIADEFDISESYFSHLFKEKKGVKIIRFSGIPGYLLLLFYRIVCAYTFFVFCKRLHFHVNAFLAIRQQNFSAIFEKM